MLYLCVDALKATATISSNRMQTLDSALRTLRTLIRLKAAVSQVGLRFSSQSMLCPHTHCRLIHMEYCTAELQHDMKAVRMLMAYKYTVQAGQTGWL